ncbi:NUDIX hydrolase [Dactylosporangium fulvum]|uniref:NUDIX domain-containing protein n=1 Tax=Dactylosporangium fulvum TaxID=53359 RepID=A0ABY5VQV3_9ACTN|nr:NUDIX domain-containing protein [Dactylosporangium fulvum]UWP78868.1 NUDIX domain-containing protein [Dactylosporangium fulvum]
MTNIESSAPACLTARGRPAFVVNVEVFLHRDGRWLLIRRGAGESHAAGLLSGVGGKVEPGGVAPDVLEATARREVAEEIGVDLTGVPLTYAASSLFVTDDGDPVVNVVFRAPVPAGAEPVAASADEVADLLWLTPAEAEASPDCPPWVLRDLRAAAALG